MIRLYHGSNVKITKIDLSLCKVGKDFGKGFYLNPDYNQAQIMAAKTCRILGHGHEVVNEYQFDESVLVNNSDLNIKIFDDYSEEWAEFIVLNRRNKTLIPAHPYDLVIGPIADDSVGVQIRRYIQGYLPVSKLVEELRFHGDHAIQYYFASDKSLSYLKNIQP